MASRQGSGAGDLQQVTSQDGGAEDAGGQQQVTSQDSGAEDAGGQQQDMDSFGSRSQTPKQLSSAETSGPETSGNNQAKHEGRPADQPPSVAHQEDVEGGSNLPEDVWLEDIDDIYPKLQEKTYFLPPFHFNRVPFTVKDIAVLRARVTAACCERPHKKKASTSQAQGSQQVAGPLFTQNPRNLETLEVPFNDEVDDRSMLKCLTALHDITGETMMVISQLVIRQYLDNKTNPDTDPRHQKAISRIPNPADLSPASLADCECDILIIHPHHGLLIAEVKSVGSKREHSDDSTIVQKVTKAIGQLDNLEVAFKQLLKDLPGISITKAVLLPYLTSSQLRSALSSSAQLRQKLIACTKSVDVDQEISRCLCSDDLEQPGLSAWWQKVWSVSHPLLSRQLYKCLVARFCGVASTVDIPTSSRPRVVVRSLGQAVAETGLRFSALILTRDQVELLDKDPPHQYLYLQGPPGTGKTLVLFLGALKSALRGKKVVIVHMPGDVAVATLFKLQLTNIVGATTAAKLIHLHPCNFRDDDLGVNADVATLRDQAGQEDNDLNVNADVATLRDQVGQEDNVHIIVDEAPDSGGDQFLSWVTAVGSTWPQALLWMAGLKIRDNTATNHDNKSLRLPQWVETATLRVSLRCTPNVTHHVAKPGRSYIDDIIIPRYVTPPVPQHTAGPDVRELRHTPGVDGHADDDYDFLGCGVCGDKVASVISELVVGQTEHGLHYRDFFVLTGYHCPAPRHNDAFVQILQEQHDQHVHVVEISVNGVDVVTTPPSADDVPQLVKAVDDKIIITHWRAVCGLERRAVFVLGGRGDWASDHVASTRTTSFLSYFTCHRPAAD